METLVYLLVGVHLVGLLLVLLAVARAPCGFEDESGFHRNGAEREASEPSSPTS